MNNSKYYLPILIYSGIIFYLSGIPGDELPSLIFSDKLAHLLEYFLWGCLAVFALKNSSGQEPRKILALVLLLGFSFAVFDEIHQLFISGRQFSRADLIFDFLGIALGSKFYL